MNIRIGSRYVFSIVIIISIGLTMGYSAAPEGTNNICVIDSHTDEATIQNVIRDNCEANGEAH